MVKVRIRSNAVRFGITTSLLCCRLPLHLGFRVARVTLPLVQNLSTNRYGFGGPKATLVLGRAAIGTSVWTAVRQAKRLTGEPKSAFGT